MKPSSAPPFLLLLALVSLAGLLYGFNRLGWSGVFLFAAGAVVALGASWAIASMAFRNRPSAGPPGMERDAAPGLTPHESDSLKATSETRDVFIPGRNFDEMLQRLGANESMLNVILNSMGEGVLLLNQADRIVLMNPSAEKILGMGERESLGKLYLEVVRNPVLAGLLTLSKKEGGLASGEIDLSGGDEKTFAVSVAAIRVERGNHLGQIVVFSDITSIKRLMRMRTEFVANVSHELKTPLTAILGYVETLLEGAIDDKKNRSQFLQKISDQAQRLHALISDVLELSKIESGGFITALEPVELDELAQQAVELLRAKWESKEIKIRQEIPRGTKVTAHREGLFHVLENLLDNAVKYSPRNSEIRIYRGLAQGGQIEFSVEDQGPGIPKEVQGRVFERFFRVDAARNREAGGTGLGLAIVKHLVEKMKGEVSLKSEEGKGSVFTVSLASAQD